MGISNFYTDVTFFGLVAVAVVVFRLFARHRTDFPRSVFLVLLSAGFLSLLRDSSHWLIAIVGYCIVLSGTAVLLRRTRAMPRASYILAGSIGLAMFILFSLKYRFYFEAVFGNFSWQTGVSSIQWIGISYLTFRAIDLLVYARSTRGKPFGFFTAAAYLLFFPSYLSGPINRFGMFLEDQSKTIEAISPAEQRKLILRIAVGVIKILLVAQAFQHYSIYGTAGKLVAHASEVGLLLSLYATFFYIYLDFSGYCDVAIALGRFFGIRLPENFRYPFLSANLQDFWNRWHITFAHFCRDYIFFILLRQLAIRARWIPNLAAQIAAIFITFFFMGAWHGSAPNWIFYGLFHAGGMVAWLLYSRVLTQCAPDMFSKLKEFLPYRIFSVWLTVTFVSAGLLLTIDLESADGLLRPYFGK